MLQKAYFCTIKSQDGLALANLVQFITKNNNVITEGLVVTTNNDTSITISPGRAFFINPLVLIRNTSNYILDLRNLGPSVLQDGYHIIGIMLKNDNLSFDVIPQIGENKWRTEYDDFIPLAILEISDGKIVDIHREHQKWTRTDIAESVTSNLFGIVLADENDESAGYLVSKIDQETIKLDTENHQIYVDPSVLFFSDLGDTEFSQIETGQILTWNGLKWINTNPTDEKVKTTPEDTIPGFLIDKIDNVSIIIDNNKLKVDPGSIPLSSLLDVDPDLFPEVDDVLQWDGTKWTNGSVALSDELVKATSSDTPGYLVDKIDNVTIAIADNKLYVNTSALSISSLGDINIASLSPDEILVWNGSFWVNQQQGRIRVSTGDTLGYLSEKIDNITIGLTTDNKLYVKPNIIPLKDLSDVDSTLDPDPEDYLKWDGSKWTASKLPEYVDEKVKVDSEDSTSGYLSDKIDNNYLVINNTKKLTLDPNKIVLPDLGDTAINDPQEGQFLRWNGSAWVNQTFTDKFVKIDNADTSGYLVDKLDLQTIIVVNSKLTVNNAEIQLNLLKDVDVTSLQNGYILRWDGSQWVSQQYQDELVKATENDTPGYLVNKVDTATIDVYDNKLRVVPDVFANKVHTHTKSDITDFNENDYVHISGNEIITGDKTFQNITITGNLIVKGETTTVTTTETVISDNVITLNSGETGNGVTNGISGIEIDRGTLPFSKLVFDESDNQWKVDNGDSVLIPISLAGHTHNDLYYTKTELQTSGSSQVHWDNITNKPPMYPSSPHTHTWDDIDKTGSLLSDIEDVPTYVPNSFLHISSDGQTLEWIQIDLGLVRSSSSDPTSGYLVDKIDNTTLKILNYRLYVDQNYIFLNNLGDVQLNSLANGQILKWNGTKWINSYEKDEKVKVSENDTTSGYLSDKIDNNLIIIDNNKLTIDQTQIYLSRLKDTDIISPDYGHVLKWNGTEWVSAEEAKVKIDGTDTSGYLGEKIDDNLIIVSNGKLTIDPSKITLQSLGNVENRTPNVNDIILWDGTRWVFGQFTSPDRMVSMDDTDPSGYLSEKIDNITIGVNENKKLFVKPNSFDLKYLSDIDDDMDPDMGHIIMYDGNQWISKKVFTDPPLLSPENEVSEMDTLHIEIINYDPNNVYTASVNDPNVADVTIYNNTVVVMAKEVDQDTTIILKVTSQNAENLMNFTEREILVKDLNLTYDDGIVIYGSSMNEDTFDYTNNVYFV